MTLTSSGVRDPTIPKVSATYISKYGLRTNNHRSNLPRDVAEPLSLEVFKMKLDRLLDRNQTEF